MASSGFVADRGLSINKESGVDSIRIEASARDRRSSIETISIEKEEQRILLEVDVKALQRLLGCKFLSVCEFRCVNNTGKQCLQSLYLDLLNRQLATLPILKSEYS